ncbi:hypothetical protein PXH69_28585 [Rhodococcus qingshengii]|uniref:Uncharacterized protein n=1 Tax=Rhodococcus qingshengii TaxID=334542 RepID=A0AAW6LPI2_RHOSG|nr:hypothetical protein [Rhodococcus qingshengii]MDE8648934.1 hypothetical protein [Rhodococcus qingshengii]
MKRERYEMSKVVIAEVNKVDLTEDGSSEVVETRLIVAGEDSRTAQASE